MKKIASASVDIIETEKEILIEQRGSKIVISNINDANLLIDILSAFKQRFLINRSFNYGLVYYLNNEEDRYKPPS